MQNWYAPSLTSNKEAGLGDWSIEDISNLLRGGISRRGVVYGPMAEVTYNSLQYMTDADTKAMALYLKSLGQGNPPAPATSALPSPESSLLLSFGKKVYDAQCASCHGLEGKGHPPHYPPLAGNPSISMTSAVNPDPHGVERRLPARHGRQPDAPRHAALRPGTVRRRDCRRPR